MISRRGFMGAILATACAPAIVRASSLMPVVSRKVVPEWIIHPNDFTAEWWEKVGTVHDFRYTVGAARYLPISLNGVSYYVPLVS